MPAKKTFREKQMEFGPYYFGGSGGGEAAPAAPGNPSAPSLDVSQAAGPVSAGVQGAKAALNATSLNAALSGLTGAKGLASTIQGMGLRGATSMVPGLNALQGLTALFSGPLGFLSGVLGKYGLQGQDTSGMNVTPEALALSNQGVPISAAQFATLTQWLGINPATLNAMNEAAPFGQEGDPSGVGVPGSSSGGLGGGPGDAGGGSADFHRGGRVAKGPPKGPERKSTLLEGEYVIKQKAYQLRKGLVEAINRGAPKAELAKIVKAGR